MSFLKDIQGQGTVEFALIGFAFLSVILGLAALWDIFEGGLFVAQAVASASHHIRGVSLGVVGDVFLY